MTDRRRVNGSRRRRRALRPFSFTAFAGWLGACSPAAPEPPAPPAVADATAAAPGPVYFTAEQAARGQSVFASVCSACHGRNEFTGPIFGLTWRAEPVSGLYEHVSTNMPQNAPGSLTPEQYADVVAYIVQLNGIAPGDRELPADIDQLAKLEW